uniref:Uncharacterized protein n=1 Tax=Timema bartmani TaxID=61472 RepID=A0A7R9F221_9NEOP|nr:unnamed protein product [Timema bartmani]
MEQLLYIVIIASLMGLAICNEKGILLYKRTSKSFPPLLVSSLLSPKQVQGPSETKDLVWLHRLQSPKGSPAYTSRRKVNARFQAAVTGTISTSKGTSANVRDQLTVGFRQQISPLWWSNGLRRHPRNELDWEIRIKIQVGAWRSSDDMMVAFQVCLGVAFIIALIALFIQCCRSCICVKKTQTPSQIAAQRVSIISRPTERVIARLDPVRDPPPQYDDIQHIVLEKPPAYQEALADTSAQFNDASWDMDPPPYIVVDHSSSRVGVENLAFTQDDLPPVLGLSSTQPNSATSADHRVGTTNNTTQPLVPRDVTEARSQTFHERFNSGHPEEPDSNKQDKNVILSDAEPPMMMANAKQRLAILSKLQKGHHWAC